MLRELGHLLKVLLEASVRWEATDSKPECLFPIYSPFLSSFHYFFFKLQESTKQGLANPSYLLIQAFIVHLLSTKLCEVYGNIKEL